MPLRAARIFAPISGVNFPINNFSWTSGETAAFGGIASFTHWELFNLVDVVPYTSGVEV